MVCAEQSPEVPVFLVLGMEECCPGGGLHLHCLGGGDEYVPDTLTAGYPADRKAGYLGVVGYRIQYPAILFTRDKIFRYHTFALKFSYFIPYESSKKG